MERPEELIRSLDEERKSLDSKCGTWALVEIAGIRRFNPFYESFGIIAFLRLVMNLAIIFIVGLQFVRITDSIGTPFAIALVIYVMVFLPLIFIGKINYNKVDKKLKEHQEKVRTLVSEYFDKKCEEAHIYNGKMYFNGGFAVGGDMSIRADLGKNYGRMKFYSRGPGFEKQFEAVMYKNFKERSDKVFLNERIASIEFNQNVGVIADEGTERECLAFLSPSKQLKLIKDRVIYSFLRREIDGCLFRIEDNTLYIETSCIRPDGGYIHYDCYSELCHHTVVNCFDQADAYVRTFPVCAINALNEFEEKASFLRESLI